MGRTRKVLQKAGKPPREQGPFPDVSKIFNQPSPWSSQVQQKVQPPPPDLPRTFNLSETTEREREREKYEKAKRERERYEQAKKEREKYEKAKRERIEYENRDNPFRQSNEAQQKLLQQGIANRQLQPSEMADDTSESERSYYGQKSRIFQQNIANKCYRRPTNQPVENPMNCTFAAALFLGLITRATAEQLGPLYANGTWAEQWIDTFNRLYKLNLKSKSARISGDSINYIYDNLFPSFGTIIIGVGNNPQGQEYGHAFTMLKDDTLTPQLFDAQATAQYTGVSEIVNYLITRNYHTLLWLQLPKKLSPDEFNNISVNILADQAAVALKNIGDKSGFVTRGDKPGDFSRYFKSTAGPGNQGGRKLKTKKSKLRKHRYNGMQTLRRRY